jgi:Transposase IS4
VFVDCFYTFIALLKELDKLNLYCTGICMRNRLPGDVIIMKKSKEFNDMQRGDFKRHTFSYVMESGEVKNYRLVCWKDTDIVYCLTNLITTEGNSSCFRHTSTGRICSERPLVIGEYNKYMGGVDLADQQ